MCVCRKNQARKRNPASKISKRIVCAYWLFVVCAATSKLHARDSFLICSSGKKSYISKGWLLLMSLQNVVVSLPILRVASRARTRKSPPHKNRQHLPGRRQEAPMTLQQQRSPASLIPDGVDAETVPRNYTKLGTVTDQTHLCLTRDVQVSHELLSPITPSTGWLERKRTLLLTKYFLFIPQLPLMVKVALQHKEIEHWCST